MELRILRARAAAFGNDPEVRAEIACRLQVLMAHAKVVGMIVDRKQVAKFAFSLNQLPRDPRALSKPELDQALDWLAPGQRAEPRRLAAGALPAGEPAVTDGESESDAT